MSALADLEHLMRIWGRSGFQKEFDLDALCGPSFAAIRGGASVRCNWWGRIFLKREDLNHRRPQGEHHYWSGAAGRTWVKKRHCGDGWATRCGKRHGSRPAGSECHVFMGEEDIRRQALNVYRMKLLGAKWCQSRQAPERSKTP